MSVTLCDGRGGCRLGGGGGVCVCFFLPFPVPGGRGGGGFVVTSP